MPRLRPLALVVLMVVACSSAASSPDAPAGPPDGIDPTGGDASADSSHGGEGGADAAPPPPPCIVTHFGPAQTFPLPAALADARFGTVPLSLPTKIGQQCAGTGTANFTTMDLGGGHEDLVVTRDECTPDAAVGTTKWLVYPGACGP